MKKKVLITGSSGLVGSQSARYFGNLGFEIHGIDNDMRKYFFGDSASTRWGREALRKELKDSYIHYSFDIRNEKKLKELFKKHSFSLIIHAAAQPSHDWAAKEPITDFTINSLSTLFLLENMRIYCPSSVFIFTSTNKVYGEKPNDLPLVEQESRYELPKNHKYYNGIDENMSIDFTKHSIFGASKVAADLMVQEYGRYFGLNTVAFRGGCLTGPSHSGAKLHGFMAYLIRCIKKGEQYSIFGYKGKQVRDNIHSYDLVDAFHHVYKKPRKGEIYNIGGSRHSNTSLLEAIKKIEAFLGKKAKVQYLKKNRIGDHIWYISDVKKFQSHYPGWKYTYNNDKIIEEICRYGHLS